jgi:uncharacterized glyoxalase superfamily protein PhnB
MSAKYIIPCLSYKDAKKSIEWLCDAFGFEKHQMFVEEDGIVSHAELKLGNIMIMIGSQQHNGLYKKLTNHPQDMGGYETQSPYIVIDDIDEHYERAKKHGAKIAIDLKGEDYGGQNYSCFDIEGHLWNFGSYDPWIAASVA